MDTAQLWTNGDAHLVVTGLGIARVTGTGTPEIVARFGQKSPSGDEPEVPSFFVAADKNADRIIVGRPGDLRFVESATGAAKPFAESWLAAAFLGDDRVLAVYSTKGADGVDRAQLGRFSVSREGEVTKLGDVALPPATKIAWPGGIWSSPGGSWPEVESDTPVDVTSLGLGVEVDGTPWFEEVRITKNAHGIAVASVYSGIVLVLDEPGAAVRFALRVPTQHGEGAVFAEATAQGVLVTVCIEERHAAVVHLSASGEVLAHRSKVGKDFAWGFGALAHHDDTRAWVTQTFSETELYELDLASLKATKVKKVEWGGMVANVAIDPSAKVRIVATDDERKLYVVDSRTGKPVVKEVPWPDFRPPRPPRPVAALGPPRMKGSPALALAKGVPVTPWSFVKGQESTVEVAWVSGGGATRGVYVELGGPAVMDKLLELVTVELGGVTKALAPKGANFRADFADVAVEAAYEEVPKGALPNPHLDPTFVRVTVRGLKAGQGLFTVRIGPMLAEPGRGSVLQGKSIAVTA